MSNVVLPSQSFEQDINNLMYSEAGEIAVSQNRRELNQSKKPEQTND